jgi:hypothetical protein
MGERQDPLDQELEARREIDAALQTAGFVDRGSGQGGAIVSIDPGTGATTDVNDGDVRWYGAGVTTDAPVVE